MQVESIIYNKSMYISPAIYWPASQPLPMLPSITLLSYWYD